MIWPFKRKAKPPRDERGWNEDWQIGDMAECVLADWLSDIPQNPAIGEVRTVAALFEGQAAERPVIVSALAFEGFGALTWHCAAFRKHKPLAADIVAAAKRGARVQDNPRPGEVLRAHLADRTARGEGL